MAAEDVEDVGSVRRRDARLLVTGSDEGAGSEEGEVEVGRKS